MDEKESLIFGKSKLSKFLYFLSWLILLLGIWFIIFPIKIEDFDPLTQELIRSKATRIPGFLMVLFALIIGYVSYRIAGGKNNPTIH